jgi:hypothetical protein
MQVTVPLQIKREQAEGSQEPCDNLEKSVEPERTLKAVFAKTDKKDE